MLPLLPIAAGAGALFLLTRKAKPAAPAGKPETDPRVAQPSKPTDASIDSLTKVIASADPATLTKAAAEMQSDGYTAVADELNRMAAEAKAGKLAPIPVPPAASDDKTKILAATASALSDMLRTAKVGAEDRKAVAEYQRLKGGLKIDGLYGPLTAKALYGDGIYPPPKPRYWPKANTAQAKADYAAWLLANQPKVRV